MPGRWGTPKQRDANEPEIVDALKAIGAKVKRVNTDEEGFPDLVVGWRGENHLIEVKMPGKRLSPAQARWHAQWTGRPAQIVHSVPEALAAIGAGTP